MHKTRLARWDKRDARCIKVKVCVLLHATTATAATTIQHEQQQQQQQIVSHPLWVIVANENEDSGSTRNRRSKSSSSSNAFKWLISLWAIVSAVRTGMRTMPSRWRGAGWGESREVGRYILTNEIAGNAQNANEMCNHPGMQHNAKCVNILPQPTLSPTLSPSFSPSLVRYMSEMSCGPCPCPCPLCPRVCHVACATALQISHLLPVTKYDTKINIID